jgi:general secretion pathway protein B
MSYILEALKKAQAERQLGNAPTIHAAQPVAAPQPGVAASRKPLLVGLGAGALVVAAGAVFLWRAAPAPAPSEMAQVAPATAPSPVAPPARLPAVSNSLEVTAPPPPVPQAVHAPRPRVAAAAPAPARAVAQAVPVVPAPPPGTAQARMPASAPLAAVAPARGSSPAPAAAPEDSLPFLQQLPEAVQREVPRVAFGGYMYSANPADRLLLVDKALRHEGEEVAPGLVLEKLLPRAAVMNYRGVRYRVAY